MENTESNNRAICDIVSAYHEDNKRIDEERIKAVAGFQDPISQLQSHYAKLCETLKTAVVGGAKARVDQALDIEKDLYMLMYKTTRQRLTVVALDMENVTFHRFKTEQLFSAKSRWRMRSYYSEIESVVTQDMVNIKYGVLEAGQNDELQAELDLSEVWFQEKEDLLNKERESTRAMISSGRSTTSLKDEDLEKEYYDAILEVLDENGQSEQLGSDDE